MTIRQVSIDNKSTENKHERVGTHDGMNRRHIELAMS